MTRIDPSLQLVRLVVLKSAGALYDEKFHPGVNIIRGENSSGKSTIADFIFFALGGDLASWTPEAAAADSVHAEVILSGKTFTLSRDIENKKSMPMYLYEGAFPDAMSNRKSWSKYPYSRSANNESFSQVLFRLLKMPEQITEGQQNITMHQILRLLYLDQMTPVDQIFGLEEHDRRETRIAIAELLLGLDDLMLHDLRQQIRIADRRYTELVAELRSIFSLLGKTSDSDISVTNFDTEISTTQTELVNASNQVERLISEREGRVNERMESQQELVSQKLRQTKEELRKARERVQEVALDIEDSASFLRTLQDRIDALDSSKDMAELFGTVAFAICPACLTPVAGSKSNGACHLCKTDLPEAQQWGHLKMREELSFQMRESNKLMESKRAELASSQDEMKRLVIARDRLLSETTEFERRRNPIDAEIASQLRRVGYLERTVEDLARKAELAAVVRGKIEERNGVGDKLMRLKNHLVDLASAREKRRSEVDHRIVELCVEALHRDLPMEESFRDAQVVEFDFGLNRLTVDGRSRFSASSSTYLKNAFIFSLFELSLIDSEVRWPRFLLLDNVEDKGMQPKRSANFQEYVVERAARHAVEHQVIMTTSMISPKLEDSVMCVGPHYDENHKSLRFATAKKLGGQSES
jgi:DNA repair exonuclease SbcCD ATPase subunit